jgi:site-specific DNA-cytosine methylase
VRVLVACEFSGVVRDAFLKRGHDAYSCDILPTTNPGPHFECDVAEVLNHKWDLLIAHPPCTDLAVSGAHRFKAKLEKDPQCQERALDFVRLLMYNSIERIAVENPVSIISTRIRKPDQIIQPYEFGHDASKKTCLWLKNLPPLAPTKYVEPRWVDGKPRWANQTDSGQNRLPPSEGRAAERAVTYQGIAEAMATQWSNQ